MTSPDSPLTYSAFCGSLLDDMLDQVICNIISRSLLDEKLIRKEYGTVENPVFHDTPAYTEKFRKENNSNSNDTTNTLDTNTTNGNGNATNGRIDLTLDDDNNDTMNSKNTSILKNTNMPSEPDIGRFRFTLNGKDVYVNAVNDNKKLLGAKTNAIVVGTAQDTYFKCSNCDRKIAGSRFSAHVDKCLGGRSRK